MQENLPESNYPIHQPRRNGHRRPPDDDLDETMPSSPSPIPNRRGRNQPEDEALPPPRARAGGIRGTGRNAPVQHQREVAAAPTLPRNRLKDTLIAGAIAGVLCIGASVIITLANASTYHAFNTATSATVKNALSFTIFGYTVLSFVISMLICLITGFVVGRIAVARRLAFLSGFVAGFIVYLVNFLLNFIPAYPSSTSGSSSSSAGAAAGGIVLVIVLLVVWGVVGGLASLLGGWLATRHHPYYEG